MKLKDKVLVVEDEQNISNFISTVLTANDFDVLVAQTGAEHPQGGSFVVEPADHRRFGAHARA